MAHHISPPWAHINGNVQSQHMTVHSAPLSVINKNIATPLNQNDLLNRKVNNEQGKEQNANNMESRSAYQNNVKYHSNETSHYPSQSANLTSTNLSHQVCIIT